MQKSVLVLDTSYLLELYEVTQYHEPDFVRRLKARMKDAIRANCRFYIPFPVLFEWANHIADVKDGSCRWSHAQKLHEEVAACLVRSKPAPPWQIFGADANALVRFDAHLHSLLKDFASHYASQQLGLVDMAIMEAARSLKATTSSLSVHIWTKHAALKAYEPDPEPEPLLE